MADNNTVLIYSNNGINLIDKVGFGSAQDSEVTTETNPTAGTSRERRASSTSTSQTMAIGGFDEFAGNGEDTNNNANDFVLRNSPQPQNSLSTIEPVPTQTPKNAPTEAPSPTPTETETPTPTSTPSPTPTDIPTPTNTPTPIRH